ncbi:AbrB/MazE/SpoVT family DNA-binding domain-containing protein [Paenibacillus illinoisensis]|nr:AbrB/MazE/SpoVT family DNA-binding domain-containing protein [Paenibacillus illinoisensis]
MNKSKHKGMVRSVDSLGRIVLPIELRRTLGVEIGDPLEYFIEEYDKRILLRKYRTQVCLFCSVTEELFFFKNYFICSSCLDEVLGNGMGEEQNKSKHEVVHSEKVANTQSSVERKLTRSKDTLLRLTKVMEQYPAASQKEWGELLGVTQGRISQLVRILNKSNYLSSRAKES